MEEVFQTLVTNMASFAQNVQIQTTATNERILQLAHTVQQVAELNPGQPRRPRVQNGPTHLQWKRRLPRVETEA